MTQVARDRPFLSGISEHIGSFEAEPFGFTHDLHRLGMFDLGNLERLASQYRAEDYFVAGGARTAETDFYSVEHGTLHPCEAIAKLDTGGLRVLLKRPENYDHEFRSLLTSLVAEFLATFDRFDATLARLQSSILISSARTITPFHFDPEVSFFFQIDGQKDYHLYSPGVLAETELENFYRRGVVDIGQVELAGRDPGQEYIFDLTAGKGHHQPRNSPHWVETGAARSISYVVSYETVAMRATDRTRAFNYYLRKLGIPAGAPRMNGVLDCAKARFMERAGPMAGRFRTRVGRR